MGRLNESMDSPQPRRFQFSLGRLLGIIAIVGAYLGIARITGFRPHPLNAAAVIVGLGCIIGTLVNGSRGAWMGTLAGCVLFLAWSAQLLL